VLGLYYSLSLLLLFVVGRVDGVCWGRLKSLGTRGVEEVGRGLLDVVAGLGRVVRRELGEEPRPEAPGPRPELARVRDHLCVKFRAPCAIDATLSP
jgi:hypothetical protein